MGELTKIKTQVMQLHSGSDAVAEWCSEADLPEVQSRNDKRFNKYLSDSCGWKWMCLSDVVKRIWNLIRLAT